MQSLRKCIQTKKGASQTTANHKPNKAISWNEQLDKPSEKAMAIWWQNTKASRHWMVSTFGQKPRHRLTMQQRVQQNTNSLLQLSRMRTDRETQGKQRDPGKDTGPWGGEFLCYLWEDKGPGGGEFLCNFGHCWGVDKINKQRKELVPSIPSFSPLKYEKNTHFIQTAFCLRAFRLLWNVTCARELFVLVSMIILGPSK